MELIENNKIQKLNNKFDNENAFFLPKLYKETLDLLLQTHDYFGRYAQSDQEILPLGAKVVYSTEMSRITARLTSIMAWVMARRAAFVGEISMDDANKKFRLDSRDVCEFVNPQAKFVLPNHFNTLLERTLTLYQRIARLDDMVDQKPARPVERRLEDA